MSRSTSTLTASQSVADPWPRSAPVTHARAAIVGGSGLVGLVPVELLQRHGLVTVVAGDRQRTRAAADRLALARRREQPEVDLPVDLPRGIGGTHLDFSDLAHHHVTLNAEYTT